MHTLKTITFHDFLKLHFESMDFTLARHHTATSSTMMNGECYKRRSHSYYATVRNPGQTDHWKSITILLDENHFVKMMGLASTF